MDLAGLDVSTLLERRGIRAIGWVFPRRSGSTSATALRLGLGRLDAKAFECAQMQGGTISASSGPRSLHLTLLCVQLGVSQCKRTINVQQMIWRQSFEIFQVPVHICKRSCIEYCSNCRKRGGQSFIRHSYLRSQDSRSSLLHYPPTLLVLPDHFVVERAGR